MMLPSITVVTLLLFTKSLLAIPIEEDSSNNDNLLDISEDYEEDDDESEIVECETIPESNPLRNGLGDDSLFLWPDKKIPFIIGDGFNETNRQNILESIEDYNTIFSGCIQWIPKTDEVMKIFCNFHLPTIWLIAYFATTILTHYVAMQSQAGVHYGLLKNVGQKLPRIPFTLAGILIVIP